jgi:hypothetical protein
MATAIGKTDVYWQIYRPSQIRATRRGRLVYVLQVPTVGGPPVMRSIFDLRGRLYPQNLDARLRAVLGDRREHGLIFAGVSPAAVEQLLSMDPEITPDDPLFFNYNWVVVRNALDFLVSPGEQQRPPWMEAFASTRQAVPHPAEPHRFRP